MKDKLHELVDASDTDTIYDIVGAIRETDLDVPNRITFDVTQPQMSFLEEVAEDALKNPDLGVTLRYIIDITTQGYRKKQIDAAMGTAPKVGKEQRKS